MWPLGRKSLMPAVAKLLPVLMSVISVDAVRTCVWHHLPDSDCCVCSSVTEFSKKTGDYPSLSATDIKVLALTYQLEQEHVGAGHLKKEPEKKVLGCISLSPLPLPLCLSSWVTSSLLTASLSSRCMFRAHSVTLKLLSM